MRAVVVVVVATLAVLATLVPAINAAECNGAVRSTSLPILPLTLDFK